MPNDLLKTAITGTTQDHLLIEDIVDDVVIQKDGSCCSVLQIASVNFDLLSEKEQSALIYAYSNILNSLNFTVQILIRTTTKDISNYVKNLRKAEAEESSPVLKERIKKYQKFIEEIVKKHDILSKSFYIVIPFSPLEMGLGEAQKQISSSLLSTVKKTKDNPYSKEYILEKAKANLAPKIDHLLRLFSRLGLEISIMETKQLINLFYGIYNPETAGVQKVKSLSYGTPIVTAKI
jgi:type IV secretory pathway VirB4 component